MDKHHTETLKTPDSLNKHQASVRRKKSLSIDFLLLEKKLNQILTSSFPLNFMKIIFALLPLQQLTVRYTYFLTISDILFPTKPSSSFLISSNLILKFESFKLEHLVIFLLLKFLIIPLNLNFILVSIAVSISVLLQYVRR